MGTKENKSIVLLIIICLMACLILSGCTGNSKVEISTSMSFDKNFKGSRQMTGTISNSIFKQAFNNDIDKLQELVKKECPTTLKCSVEPGDKGIDITMTLEFANLKDYTNKVGQILEKTPGIYFEQSNTMFKNGFMLKENFSSRELFGWLVKVINTQYSQLKDATMDDLFVDGMAEVVYQGETIETTSQIDVNKMESHAFDSLAVEITMNEDDTFGVQMNFIVDQDVYYTMGDKMDETMKKLTPSGGVFDVSDSDKQRVYSISFSAYNTDTLIAQLNSVLGTEDCVFDIEETGDENDPFKARRTIKIYMDGSYFLDFSKASTDMVYLLKTGSEYAFDQCESSKGYLKKYAVEQENKYTSVYMTVSPPDEIVLNYAYAIDMKGIDVDTRMISPSEYERDLTFKFDTDKALLVNDNFESRLGEHLKEDMTMETQEASGTTSYIVHINGKTLEEISEKTTLFLDGSVKKDALTSYIIGGKSDKKMLKVRKYEYEDHVDFQQFLGGASVSDGITYVFEYPKGYTAKFLDGSYTDMVSEKNTLSCTTKDQIVVVRSEGSVANISGLIQFFVWWGSLVLLIISMIFNAKHIIGYIKKRDSYVLETELLKGRNLQWITVAVVAVTVFLIVTIRLIFKVY